MVKTSNVTALAICAEKAGETVKVPVPEAKSSILRKFPASVPDVISSHLSRQWSTCLLVVLVETTVVPPALPAEVVEKNSRSLPARKFRQFALVAEA